MCSGFQQPLKGELSHYHLIKPSTHQISIVFSFWKTTLDIARTALNEAGIACVQIDGKVKPKDRKAIFEKFQTDDTTRILLLSLSCGAVG